MTKLIKQPITALLYCFFFPQYGEGSCVEVKENIPEYEFVPYFFFSPLHLNDLQPRLQQFNVWGRETLRKHALARRRPNVISRSYKQPRPDQQVAEQFRRPGERWTEDVGQRRPPSPLHPHHLHGTGTGSEGTTALMWHLSVCSQRAAARGESFALWKAKIYYIHRRQQAVNTFCIEGNGGRGGGEGGN